MKQAIKNLFNSQLGVMYIILVVLVLGMLIRTGAGDSFGARVSTSSNEDSSGNGIVVGNVANNAADSGNPVLIGGTYSSTTDELDDGDRGSLVLDVIRNLKVTLATKLDETNDHVTTHEEGYNYSYVAAPAANTIVKATSGKLVRIIAGAWVANGTIECSDHATDGDGNVEVFITMAATNIDAFPKVFEVGAEFATGITCDTIGATQVTFIYE